jgi:hypothetical protein
MPQNRFGQNNEGTESQIGRLGVHKIKSAASQKIGLLHLLLFRKWCFEFCGQNTHQNKPKLEGFGAGKNVQENNCFIGQGLVLYILHQVCRLTVKKGAKGFDIFP